MKKNYLIACVLLILAGCSSKMDEISITKNETENKEEKVYQKALDLVKEFAEKVNRPKSKSFNFSDVEIKNVEKSSLPIKFTKEMPAIAKSGEIDMKESVDIYTFQFMKDGKEGFAIATDDPRHPTVLAYIEEGRLADTVENSAPAFVFRNIKNIVLSDINRYYGEKLFPQAKAKVIYQNWQFQPILTTKWIINSPYNNNYHKPNGGSCSNTNNGKYPASYTAIALAQCIAAYPSDPIFKLDLPTLLTQKYNVRAFASTQTITANSPHATKVAQFVREFDSPFPTGGYTTFTCNGTKTTLDNAHMGLNNVGLSRDYYRYNGTNTKLAKFVEYIVKACRFDCPTVMAGYNSSISSYAVWIIDAMNGPVAEDWSDYGDIFVHCNFMRDGQFDGWLKNFQAPKGYYGNFILGADYSYYLQGIHFRPVSPYIDPQY